MPILPISDGKGNLRDPCEVLSAIQCVLLWPKRPDYGRDLFQRAAEGDEKAEREIEHSHIKKIAGIITAGEVLFGVICLFFHHPQFASLNNIFRLMQEAPPEGYGPDIKITPSASDLQRNWLKYKNVSHLARAYFFVPPPKDYQHPSKLWVRKITVRAEALRMAGESIHLARTPRGQTILDPEGTWKVPPDILFSQEELSSVFCRMGQTHRKRSIEILKGFASKK